MTYRDDHDAALQRIAALEGELEREKAERERVAGERDAIANEMQRALTAPPVAPIVARTAPLTADEQRWLADTLERGARATRNRARFGMFLAPTLIALGLVALVAGTAVGGACLIISGTIFNGAAIMGLWRTSPDRWDPVLAAVRERPDDVIAIRRIPLRRSRRSLVIVETRTGELHLRGDGALVRQLARHCPNARIDD